MAHIPQLDTTTVSPGRAQQLPKSLCSHSPACPTADSPDREAAHVVASHPGQGWSLLCNAVLLFEVMSICQSQGLV